MDAAESLHEEHILIAKMLTALDDYVTNICDGSSENRHDLLLMVTFFREFADLIHHEKEESLILPALVRAGMSWDDSPIDEIRKDHNLERYMMQSLRHASLQSREWSVDDRCHLVDVARSFIDFMRKHLAKEESTLLPALRERLSPDAQELLRSRLQRFDARFRDSGEADVIRNLADDLSKRYPGKVAGTIA